MTDSHMNFRLTLRHLLIPLSLLSLTIFLFLAFQMMQLMRDRDSLNITKGQQEQALQQSQRLQSQLSGLLSGTQRLAEKGNKNAKVISDRLKELGVLTDQTQQQATAGAATSQPPVPVDDEKQQSAPVKP